MPSGRNPPPVEHRFKPGVSGNPSGRPKAKPSFLEDARDILALPVQGVIGDKLVKLSPLKAMMRKLCASALAGDVKALRAVIEMAMVSAEAAVVEDETRRAQVETTVDRVIRLRFFPPEMKETLMTAWLKKPTAAELRQKRAMELRAMALIREREKAGDVGPHFTAADIRQPWS